MKQIIINSIQEMDTYLDSLREIRIWVCNTACGKSYLASLDDRFFDLDAYRSKLHHLGVEDFDDKTIPKMWEVLKSGKIILNAAHGPFLNYLEEQELPFVYMYGKPEVEAEYIERMRHRGSSEDFVQRFGTIIAAHYSNRANDKRGTFKIEMTSNEFVSDYIWKVFGMPKKYIQSHEFNSAQYKMAFIDVDGTLLDREGKISELTKKTIKQLKSKVDIVLTTGRGVDRISPILKELGLNKKENVSICFNGEIILRGNGEILKEHCIAKTNVKQFLQKFDSQYFSKCYLRTFDNKVCLNDLENMQQFLAKNKVYKIMFIGSQEEVDKILPNLNQELKHKFNIFNSADGLLEFVSKRDNKAKAGGTILNSHKFTRENLIAIGNSKNDIDLFDMADCSIAVCNANEDVKNHARYITDSNNDNGVAKALMKIYMH